MAATPNCFENPWKDKNEISPLDLTTMSTFDWLERPPMVQDIEINEEDEDEDEEEEETEPQVWQDFDDTRERFRKSLYYGRTPSSDRLSLPVTELCVSRFNDLGIEDLEAKLNKLDVSRAAEITRATCASPTSLVLALLYLDRLRKNNPKYLHGITSTDLFLVSLMVSSKFLHDDGEEDEVFNDEWANSGGMEKKELNKLELKFLTAIDWNIYVSPEDYEATAQKLEWAVANREVAERGWTTYTDLIVLSRHLRLIKLWELLYEYTIKVTTVCAVAYAASLMTMVGTCHMLSRSQLFGPTSMHNSIQTLYSALRTKRPSTINQTAQEVIINAADTQIDIIEDLSRLTGADSTDETLDSINFQRLSDPGGLQDTYYKAGNESHHPLFLLPKCDHFSRNHHDHDPFFKDHDHNPLFKDNLMMSRLTKALFALKVGSVRDLMIGPHITSGLGYV